MLFAERSRTYSGPNVKPSEQCRLMPHTAGYEAETEFFAGVSLFAGKKRLAYPADAVFPIELSETFVFGQIFPAGHIGRADGLQNFHCLPEAVGALFKTCGFFGGNRTFAAMHVGAADSDVVFKVFADTAAELPLYPFLPFTLLIVSI